MTAPAVLPSPDDPFAKARQLRAAGVPLNEIDQYLQSKLGAPPSAAPAHNVHAEYRSGQLARRMAAENGQDEAESGGNAASRALGTVAAFLRVPGMEAVQAGASALANNIPYTQARNEIRDAESSAPAYTRIPAEIAGGVLATSVLPASLSPAMQGAVYGAASGALQSDPNAGIGKRTGDAAIGGAVGAVTGKVGENVSNAVRSLAAKRLSTQQGVLNAVRQQIDARNYGTAAMEGWLNGGTSPAVQAALAAPDIAPYADIVRQSRTMGGADDATILREAYKLMSERQGSLGTRILNADDFKAGSSLEQQDLTAAKGVLRNAAEAQPDPLMPSFGNAIDEHAAVKSLESANKSGSRITRALMSGKQGVEKNLLNVEKSPDAFISSAVPNMTPDEASSALSGVFGRTKDYLNGSANPLTGFGVLPSLANAGKISPLVRALDQRTGGSPLGVSLLRSLLTSQGHPNP